MHPRLSCSPNRFRGAWALIVTYILSAISLSERSSLLRPLAFLPSAQHTTKQLPGVDLKHWCDFNITGTPSPSSSSPLKTLQKTHCSTPQRKIPSASYLSHHSPITSVYEANKWQNASPLGPPTSSGGSQTDVSPIEAQSIRTAEGGGKPSPLPKESNQSEQRNQHKGRGPAGGGGVPAQKETASGHTVVPAVQSCRRLHKQNRAACGK